MEKKKIPSRMIGVLLRPNITFQEIAEHPDLIGPIITLLSFYLVNALVYVISSTTQFTLLGRYGVCIQVGLNQVILFRTISGFFLLLAGWALISLLLKVAYDLRSWRQIACPLGYAFMGGILVLVVEGLTVPFHPHFVLPGPEEFELFDQLRSNWSIIMQWFFITLAFRAAVNLVISIFGSYGFHAVEGKLSQTAMFLRIFLFLTAFSIIHLIFTLPIEYLVLQAASD